MLQSFHPAASCDILPFGLSLTESEARRIVLAHNKLRQKVAEGSETRGNPGPQPAAKFMPDMVWDDELALIAQKWALQCNFAHDECRDVDRFEVGQNIAYISTTGPVDKLKVESIIQHWYSEVHDLDSTQVSKFSLDSGNGKPIGHYTQMVWAKTTKVGCGGVKYRRKGANTLFLVCNYGPAGNWLGEPIYEIKSH
ncbi:hypothetical protein QAD02_019980 [Eretmocerus hayati]|uniref:Uncharacterized protein n=1 Tax=Eretmocerus hayati TaxID=131215 RepID=A0ACC2PL80_9HYME|nr:hypothetical protein QAD02_019980 [Eretmocerus hayati]